jgi:DNA-binding IscR family transcriptional regulator
VDIPAVEQVNYSTIRSMKNLLFIISQIVPMVPNIQSLSEKIGVSRNSVLKALDLMAHAQIINLLRSSNKGVSLQKPEKYFSKIQIWHSLFQVKSLIWVILEKLFL